MCSKWCIEETLSLVQWDWIGARLIWIGRCTPCNSQFHHDIRCDKMPDIGRLNSEHEPSNLYLVRESNRLHTIWFKQVWVGFHILWVWKMFEVLRKTWSGLQNCGEIKLHSGNSKENQSAWAQISSIITITYKNCVVNKIHAFLAPQQGIQKRHAHCLTHRCTCLNAVF